MLTQNNLDLLMQSIQAGKKTYIYYVASLVETREGYIEELKYKSVPEYKVVKLNLTNIETSEIEWSDKYLVKKKFERSSARW